MKLFYFTLFVKLFLSGFCPLAVLADYKSYCNQINGLVYNGTCYGYIATVSNSWADAFTLCQNEGIAANMYGRLAWLPDNATWQAVSRYLRNISVNVNIWFGSKTDNTMGGNTCCFYWMNTTTDFAQKISPPYLTSIPNNIVNTRNLCLRIYNIISWWDADCNAAGYSRLCQYLDIHGTTSTSTTTSTSSFSTATTSTSSLSLSSSSTLSSSTSSLSTLWSSSPIVTLFSNNLFSSSSLSTGISFPSSVDGQTSGYSSISKQTQSITWDEDSSSTSTVQMSTSAPFINYTSSSVTFDVATTILSTVTQLDSMPANSDTSSSAETTIFSTLSTTASLSSLLFSIISNVTSLSTIAISHPISSASAIINIHSATTLVTTNTPRIISLLSATSISNTQTNLTNNFMMTTTPTGATTTTTTTTTTITNTTKLTITTNAIATTSVSSASLPIAVAETSSSNITFSNTISTNTTMSSGATLDSASANLLHVTSTANSDTTLLNTTRNSSPTLKFFSMTTNNISKRTIQPITRKISMTNATIITSRIVSNAFFTSPLITTLNKSSRRTSLFTTRTTTTTIKATNGSATITPLLTIASTIDRSTGPSSDASRTNSSIIFINTTAAVARPTTTMVSINNTSAKTDMYTNMTTASSMNDETTAVVTTTTIETTSDDNNTSADYTVVTVASAKNDGKTTLVTTETAISNKDTINNHLSATATTTNSSFTKPNTTTASINNTNTSATDLYITALRTTTTTGNIRNDETTTVIIETAPSDDNNVTSSVPSTATNNSTTRPFTTTASTNNTNTSTELYTTIANAMNDGATTIVTINTTASDNATISRNPLFTITADNSVHKPTTMELINDIVATTDQYTTMTHSTMTTSIAKKDGTKTAAIIETATSANNASSSVISIITTDNSITTRPSITIASKSNTNASIEVYPTTANARNNGATAIVIMQTAASDSNTINNILSATTTTENSITQPTTSAAINDANASADVNTTTIHSTKTTANARNDEPMTTTITETATSGNNNVNRSDVSITTTNNSITEPTTTTASTSNNTSSSTKLFTTTANAMTDKRTAMVTIETAASDNDKITNLFSMTTTGNSIPRPGTTTASTNNASASTYLYFVTTVNSTFKETTAIFAIETATNDNNTTTSLLPTTTRSSSMKLSTNIMNDSASTFKISSFISKYLIPLTKKTSSFVPTTVSDPEGWLTSSVTFPSATSTQFTQSIAQLNSTKEKLFSPINYRSSLTNTASKLPVMEYVSSLMSTRTSSNKRNVFSYEATKFNKRFTRNTSDTTDKTATMTTKTSSGSFKNLSTLPTTAYPSDTISIGITADTTSSFILQSSTFGLPDVTTSLAKNSVSPSNGILIPDSSTASASATDNNYSNNTSTGFRTSASFISTAQILNEVSLYVSSSEALYGSTSNASDHTERTTLNMFANSTSENTTSTVQAMSTSNNFRLSRVSSGANNTTTYSNTHTTINSRTTSHKIGSPSFSNTFSSHKQPVTLGQGRLSKIVDNMIVFSLWPKPSKISKSTTKTLTAKSVKTYSESSTSTIEILTKAPELATTTDVLVTTTTSLRNVPPGKFNKSTSVTTLERSRLSTITFTSTTESVASWSSNRAEISYSSVTFEKLTSDYFTKKYSTIITQSIKTTTNFNGTNANQSLNNSGLLKQTTMSAQMKRKSALLKLIKRIIQSLGCAYILGILCAIICIFEFLRIHSTERLFHLVQELALFLAHLDLVLFFDSVSNHVLCVTAAIFLHFCFTTFFTFQALEALHIYCTLTDTLKVGRAFETWAIGFGIPAVLTFISALAFREQYPSEVTCWLNFDTVAPKAFYVPAFVIVSSAVVLLEATSIERKIHLRHIDRRLWNTMIINQHGLLILLPLNFIAMALGQITMYCGNIALFPITFGFNVTNACFILTCHALGNCKFRKVTRNMLGRVKNKLVKTGQVLGIQDIDLHTFFGSEVEKSFTF